MKRSTLLLLLGTVFLAFGYTTEPGEGISKIHLSGDLLIRNVAGEKISLYSVSNPYDVQQVGSIEIADNHDLATSGEYLYADQGEALQVWDISSPSEPLLVSSVDNVFEHEIQQAPTAGERAPVTPENVRANRERTGGEVGGMASCGSGCGTNDRVMASSNSSGSSGNAAGAGSAAGGEGAGTGGSMTRFVVVGTTLYCVDGDQLKIFNVIDPASPTFVKTVTVETGLETVFLSDDYLFVGGRQGMYIYSVSDPENPTPISTFRHQVACDPVVVDGDYAYVTLRDGTLCGNTVNELQVVDISDIENPVLIKTIPMKSPYGLAARDGIVMVCDGEAGLAVLRTDGGIGATKCDGVQGITAHDVIWQDDLAVITAGEGFWLYDASNPCEMKPYSQLDFE